MHPLSAHLRYRTGVVTAGLLLASIATMLFAGVTGSVAIPLADLPGALQELLHGRADSLAATLLDLRAGRALTAFVTGATLSLAGVMMQALLRNPLADPYVLGISAGSAVGALGALMLMCAAWMVDLSAFIGAVAISMLLYVLARRDMRGGSAAEGGTALLLLTGTILSSACAALIMLMLSIAPESRLRSMVFWMIGDLSG
ncbi:MAG TPA: iron chelate uptake ABC transporter family permease subunit, partial [Pseudoduganella sp.]